MIGMLPTESGTVDAVFGRPLPDGSYQAYRGRMHFTDGALVGVHIDRGKREDYCPCPAGPAVVCLFDLGPRISPDRSAAVLRRLTFRDGVLIDEAPPASVLVDVSWWPDFA
jgi:hypothetical protein